MIYIDISRDPYQCSPLSAAQLCVLVGILSGLSVSVLCCVLWWVASSYSHLILVSSCETLPPYFQAWVSPVGASAFVAPGYPSLFLSFSFFLGVGGRACFFCSSVSIRSFFGQHTCFLLRCYPILSVLPCLAQPTVPSLALPCYRRSRWILCQCSVCLVSVLLLGPRLERSSLRSRGILLYPLCHKAFEPVDNFVFSVDIYQYSVYNYLYLHSVILVFFLFFLYVIFL